MHKIRTALLAITLAITFNTALAEETGKFPGVEGLMTDEQYRSSGMEKLSPQERDALNQWLIEYTAWEAPAIRKTSAEVKEVEQKFEISAKIQPPFEGWDGKTVFYLDNGQVWRQRLKGRYYYSGEDTRVTIKKNLFGFYVMTLESTGKSIGVSRIN